LTVTLTVLTENPTPLGLPTRLAITAAHSPAAGGRVDVNWQALDGDPDIGPRAGPGQLEFSSDGTRATITLTAQGQPAGSANPLQLSGTRGATEITGKFLDRLFYPRAGLFEAAIQ